MCGRKRRNTGSTARISALDAPMALNWLAAAQVALLLILTDNSAALCSYSATILLASRIIPIRARRRTGGAARRVSRVVRDRLREDGDGRGAAPAQLPRAPPPLPPVPPPPQGRRGARGRRRPRQARDRCALGPRPQGPQIRLRRNLISYRKLTTHIPRSPAAHSEESGESSIPESRARARPWRAAKPQHKLAADRLPP